MNYVSGAVVPAVTYKTLNLNADGSQKLLAGYSGGFWAGATLPFLRESYTGTYTSPVLQREQKA